MRPIVAARAPLRWFGLVLVGCPDCRAVIGIDGAPGLRDALALHGRVCPAADDVCPACGCEAELHPYGTGWRCGDCLGEHLFDTLTSAVLARPTVHAIRVPPAQAGRSDAAEPAERAVA